MAVFSECDLDEFVKKTDSLGGPNSLKVKEFWNDFSYEYKIDVDQNLDPFSDEYFAQQLSLYTELSARELNQAQHEFTPVEVDHYVDKPNPYGLMSPSALVAHYLRLGIAISRAELPSSPKILDMGAGWGLSSEFLNTLGADVTAVDINHRFVELINRRASLRKLNIKACVGSFDEFSTTERFDAVVFYECLHHATKPWNVLKRLSRYLTPGGKTILAGEPINNTWWKSWGMRLDPLSVYCVRKYGWFESGWSKEFILECLRRAGIIGIYLDSGLPEVGPIVIGVGTERELTPGALLSAVDAKGWTLDGHYIVAKATSVVNIKRVDGVQFFDLRIRNFRPRETILNIFDEKELLISTSLPLGVCTITIPLKRTTVSLRLAGEEWVPAEEVGNSDHRRLSYHVVGGLFR